MDNYVDVDYQNPDATKGLKLAIKLISNTPEEELEYNIRSNSLKYTNWMQYQEPHDGVAVLIGGGPSAGEYTGLIKELQDAGAAVFALNAASKWAMDNLIPVDIQVIIDAKEETASLVDPQAHYHLFASRCNPSTLERADELTLFHMEQPGIEGLFPEERVKQGGYVMVGGDTTVGVCALCVAFTQGFRDFHVFGYDSSHREGKSHAYKQLMNNNMPTMEVEQGGRKYISSIAMSKQPSSFMAYTRVLKDAGCSFHVYGDGLLQAVYKEECY